MNTRVWEAVNILRDYGFHTPDDIIDNLYRVIKAKTAINVNKVDADSLYATRQKETEHSVGRFPVDATLFNRVYRTLADLNAHDIIFL